MQVVDAPHDAGRIVATPRSAVECVSYVDHHRTIRERHQERATTRVLTVHRPPIPLVEAEPAFLLDEGIAHVRGWATAQHSAAALKDALAELGQEHAMPFGAGIVELGRVTPETADLIARALRTMGSAAGKRDGFAA